MIRLRPWLGGCGAALVIAAAVQLLRTPWLRPGDENSIESAHLAGQQVTEVEIGGAGCAVPLGVVLDWSGSVTGLRDGVVRFVADPALVVLLATLDGVPLLERDPSADGFSRDLVAQPASLRELGGAPQASGRLAVRALLPLPRGRTDPATQPSRTLAALFRVSDRSEDAPAAPALAAREVAAIGGADALAPAPPCMPPAPHRATVVAFAVQPAGERVAVARPADEQGGPGVVLLDGGSGQFAEQRFVALPQPPCGLEWVAGAAALLVRFEGGDAALVEVARGAIRWLEDSVVVSADGFALLERREVARGAFVQRRRDLRSAAWRTRRLAGTRPVAFAALQESLFRAATGGAIECLADDGSVARRLPVPFAACRAAIPTPVGWCSVVDSTGGARVEFHAIDAPSVAVDVPVAPWHLAVEPDGSVLRIAGASSAGGGRFALAEVTLMGGDPAARVRLVWRGDLEPVAAPDRHGLLLAELPTAAESRDAPRHAAARRLFHLPARTFGAADVAPRACATARLDVCPAVGGSGRYLYFLRAPDGAL